MYPVLLPGERVALREFTEDDRLAGDGIRRRADAATTQAALL